MEGKEAQSTTGRQEEDDPEKAVNGKYGLRITRCSMRVVLVRCLRACATTAGLTVGQLFFTATDLFCDHLRQSGG
jgi:hypothetical protein